MNNQRYISFNSLHPYEITYFFDNNAEKHEVICIDLNINFIDFVCI